MSMADPKYDKLYGIARDQPDVYETSDLPEADQPGEIYEEKSDAVERLHISASEAYSKFQGKEVDSSSVDFSDRIGRKSTNGYNIRANSWELAGLGEKETPLQTYNRLKLEVEHLVEDLSNVSVETNENLTKVSSTLNISVEATQELFSKLVELKLEDKIGFDFGKSIEHPEEQQFSKVISHLSSVGKESTKKPCKEAPEKEIFDENAVQVMLKFNPNKQMQFTSRLTDLEQKLGKLETLIGANSAQVIRLCNVNPSEGLINCCQWMVAKLSLLDSSQLDTIESKLSNVNSRLEQCINSQNSLMQDPEKEKKVSHADIFLTL